jgi:hypothetical protein
VLALLGAAPAARAQKNRARKHPAPPSQEEMMKRWQEAATPGEGHKVLEQFVGEWETTTRMWMEGPAKPAAESKGTSVVSWVMDGRFIQQESTGQMMGMPHRGVGFTGYDNFKKKYVMSWIDNTATALYTGEGTADRDGKVMTFYGKMDEPMTGEKNKTIRYVTRIIDRDKHVFEIYDLVGTPNEFKALEIIYTRKKSQASTM